jgi:hypothetical protein
MEKATPPQNYHTDGPESEREAARDHATQRVENIYKVWFALLECGIPVTALELYWKHVDCWKRNNIDAYEIRRRLYDLASPKNSRPIKAIRCTGRKCTCTRKKALTWRAI